MSRERKIVYNFQDCLSQSKSSSDLPFWESCYRQFFPTFQAMLCHRDDGFHQRQGIDRSVILSNSKQILIDEKTRWRNRKTGCVYGDIALEEYSDVARKIPGWAVKSLLCDYIAYAIVPLGLCYLLPVLQMQSAWSKNSAMWKVSFPKKIIADNEGYQTLSWGIPHEILFPAMGGCFRATFSKMENGEVVA